MLWADGMVVEEGWTEGVIESSTSSHMINCADPCRPKFLGKVAATRQKLWETQKLICHFADGPNPSGVVS